METMLYLGLPFLAAFLFQLLVGCRNACRPLCYVPLYGFGLTLLLAAASLAADPGLFVGLNALAALLWGSIGACLLVGYALAHLVYKILPK